MEREALAGWLRLSLTPGVGNDSARRLLAAFGLPEAVFAQSLTALEQVVSTTQAHALHTEPEGFADQLALTCAWLADPAAPADSRRDLVALGDPAYPQALLNIEDPPLLLYRLGQLDGKQNQPQAPEESQKFAIESEANEAFHGLAIVGSRNPTPQGEANARQFARSLAGAGLTVVSGLALGVDGAAHEGALEGAAPGQLATLAVVGTGLDRVYPKKHRDLAHRIAQRGQLISEYPLGTPPLAPNFPRRNRIISGLARGTLVVEAAVKSGSLITARMALEQGKDVFAIPGSIHSTQSRGCHALIKQGAKLVESAQDVLEELRWPGVSAVGAAPAPADGTHAPPDPDDTVLLERLGFDPVSLDALVARTGLDAASLQARLLTLELDGQVARLPGGLFQRMGTA
ncbi:MAG: DNA-protecting protein DprA [Betaproteobacteria bacterium HGW-Betaproteobacteria-3]|jgi:DNA processing protein|nr:MAG: DNA-protecting protein DprA [Betaproteobacteria bacterium HGW-Betaproteobacteria-3]